MSDLLAHDGRPDFNRWSRKNHTLVIEKRSHRGTLAGGSLFVRVETLARVQRVRKGIWRALMVPKPKGAQQCSPNFKRMEDACLWAEARLPLVELQGLE